jgi:dTDP-4-dehydrorhamnose 3,5-epimerase-like enzyme
MRKTILNIENLSIEGVKLVRLILIVDDRGYLIEILHKDDEFFKRFGQMTLGIEPSFLINIPTKPYNYEKS